MQSFKLLDIEKTTDIKLIKKAYAKIIEKYHPEEYPEKFSEIQQAYQIAISYAKSQIKIQRKPFDGESYEENFKKNFKENHSLNDSNKNDFKNENILSTSFEQEFKNKSNQNKEDHYQNQFTSSDSHNQDFKNSNTSSTSNEEYKNLSNININNDDDFQKMFDDFKKDTKTEETVSTVVIPLSFEKEFKHFEDHTQDFEEVINSYDEDEDAQSNFKKELQKLPLLSEENNLVDKIKCINAYYKFFMSDDFYSYTELSWFYHSFYLYLINLSKISYIGYMFFTKYLKKLSVDMPETVGKLILEIIEENI